MYIANRIAIFIADRIANRIAIFIADHIVKYIADNIDHIYHRQNWPFDWSVWFCKPYKGLSGPTRPLAAVCTSQSASIHHNDKFAKYEWLIFRAINMKKYVYNATY